MMATVPEDRAGEDSARVRVSVDGAIKTPAVRGIITSVMEGALAAFDFVQENTRYKVSALNRQLASVLPKF